MTSTLIISVKDDGIMVYRPGRSYTRLHIRTNGDFVVTLQGQMQLSGHFDLPIEDLTMSTLKALVEKAERTGGKD